MEFDAFSSSTDLLAPIISALETYSEPQDILVNVQKCMDFLDLYPINELNDLLKYIMPVIPDTMKKIYEKNNLMVHSGGNGILNTIRNNFQILLNFADIAVQVLDHVVKRETILFVHVSSLPINVAQVLFLTYDHCKSSQKFYNTNFKSVTEILDLFRKTQELHSKFLSFLDVVLTFDLQNEEEMIIFKELLDLIIKNSEILSGINIKSMADNWKGYITLIQKYSTQLTTLDLSSAVKSLTTEIENNLHNLYETGHIDFKKATQNLKVTGFLIKVALKLLEGEIKCYQNSDVLKFCLVIYNWHCGFFRTEQYPDDLVEVLNNILYLSTESYVHQLLSDPDFVKYVCLLDKRHTLLLKYNFGFLHFTSELLKRLPNVINHGAGILNDFHIISLLNLIFFCTDQCYKQYYCDYDSIFYEELVINVAITILLIPQKSLEIEKLLLKCIIQDKIWTALIAADIWCAVLRFSQLTTCCSILNVLVTKTDELNLGIFIETPGILQLKTFIQRLFRMLPANSMNEFVSKYNPRQNILIWRTLNFGDLPLSQRFHIEFVLSDLFDKIANIANGESQEKDVVLLMNIVDIVSYTNFNNLEINTSRLMASVYRLWSFDIQEMADNNFSKYFIYKLTKLTISVVKEITAQHLLLILNQLKQLQNETVFQLLVCTILQKISKRDFNSFHEKFTLFSLISDVFQILFKNGNPVIVQIALDTFACISESDNYGIVINKVAASSPNIKNLIAKFMRKDVGQFRYSVEYFRNIERSVFQHRCLQWTISDLPEPKKIKIDSKVDDVINILRDNTQILSQELKKTELSVRQANDIKKVIDDLAMLVR